MKHFPDISNVCIDIISNFDLAAVISAMIAISASIYIFRTTPKYELVRERYHNLIFPLFDLLEPYLFKPYSDDILNKAFRIIDENKSIAGNKILYATYYCQINPCQEHFDLLCKYVSKDYDRCSARLGLEKRSISYKIARNQYKSKSTLVIFVIWKTLIFSVVLMAFVFILFYIFMSLGIITGIEMLPLAK